MSMAPQQRRMQNGFTLVEVTVALVLTSMLAALLTSALYFAGRTRVAVSSDMQDQIRLQISANRFEQILGNCLPGVARGELVFRGNESSVACLSTQSLTTSDLRTPVRVTWKIAESEAGQSLLLYTDEGVATGAD